MKTGASQWDTGSETSLRAGDWVEVLSKEAILRTLDERGQLDGLPFMPTMFEHCGKRYRVFKRAHKTCDTVNRTGGRRMAGAVHLEGVRCSGKAHGGCEAACLVFWKTAWLRRVDSSVEGMAKPTLETPRPHPNGGCTEEEVSRGTQAPGSSEEDPTYVCQATRLPQATTPLPWWDMRQYLEDYSSGNEKLSTLLQGAAYVGYFALVELAGRLRGRRTLIRLYDRFQALRGGVPFPRKPGRVPEGQKTPNAELGLCPGEFVRVKSHDEILLTLDGRGKNRGLYFDAEEVPYCGKSYRVRSRVSRIVDERTGKMIPVKGNTVILDDVWCKGHYSDRRMFCPRAIYPFWRETWLERENEAPNGGTSNGDARASGAGR